VPPITKDDLMSNWDQVVTDRRLRLDRLEDHLAGPPMRAAMVGAERHPHDQRPAPDLP